jgi:hypothetical protein
VRKMIYLTLVVGTLGLLTAIPTGTYAASSSGAQVTNEHQCSNVFSSIVCVDVHSETNNVQTPSDNLMVEENQTFAVTITDPSFTDTQNGRFHFHELVNDGTLQELQHRDHETIVFTPTGGPTQTCVLSFAYHQANGQIQYDHFNFTCTP